MPINVGPDVSDTALTHHIKLTNRKGKSVGLILCDAKGSVVDWGDALQKVPIERTALKTSTGNSSYSDFEYPYSPIVQDDWSGGRGSLDFERDNTKFYDSMRMRTGKANKAFLGPQEQYTTGYRSQDNATPGNVKFQQLLDGQRFIAKRFAASTSYTAATAWLITRRRGAPKDLTFAIYSDNAGEINAELSHIHVTSTRMTDILSEWLDETISQALTGGNYYWIMVYGDADDTTEDHWEVAVKNSVGTTYKSTTGGAWANWSAADFDLYFRLTDADTDKSAIFFEYMEQQYCVISPTSGAPKIYMNGDRGVAQANTGQLNKLIDSAQVWGTNILAGCVVMITNGTGKNEPQTWRVITANDAQSVTVDTNWTITQDNTTEYVILGVNIWKEITGHGLTGPVTSVLVTTQGIVLFAQGDNINIRRHRAYNNAGTWTRDWADDGTNKAVHLTYKPQAKLIFRGQNVDANGDVSVSSASPVAWATASHTFAAAVPIGSKYRRINGLGIYLDDSGIEALWVGKTDRPWIVPTTGNPYPFSLQEMENVRSDKNFKAFLTHNVYLWFSMMNGLERWYNGNLDDMGPNLGEGLPAGRQGPVSAMIGYPGKFFASVDAGATGYSSVLDRDSNGWHERYRAPLGKRITAMGFQVIPGSKPDRLWIYQGNDLIWLPMPSDTTNELEDSNYLFTHEGCLVQSRMHAGMMDVQKLIKVLKLWTDKLAEDVCWIEMDYRLNEDTEWTTIKNAFDQSPQSEVDLTDVFGVAGKRVQIRLRFYTTNASLTPVLLVTIYDAVMRTDIKYMYPITFRLMDDEMTLLNSEPDDISSGMEKLQILEDWSDASSDSMLMMNCASRLFDGKMVFLNPPTTRPVMRQIYVCTASLQEA